MDKYLLEILKDVNTIIIPGLGALTITNADKGEIMFMSYLKHDDGKLTSYIAEKEGMDENEAKNLVAKYVREINIELDKGESYDMYNFGSFYKNDGEPDFKSWAAMHPTEEKATPPPVIEAKNKEDDNILIPPTPIEEEKVEEIKEETPVVEDKPLVKEEEVKIEEKKPEPKAVAAKPIKEDKPKSENTFIPPTADKKELNILEKEEKEATAAKLEKLRQDQEDQKKKKKRGAGFYVLMALIVLLIGSGTFFGLNYDEYKQHVPFLADNSGNDKEEEISQLEQMEEMLNGEIEEEIETAEENTEDSEGNIEEEELVTEETQEIEEEVVEEPLPPIQNTGNDLPFHVIAGAFSSESNANRLGDKLRNSGHQVKVGKGRGMHLVSVKSFATRAEAQSGLSSLKDVAPNGWVYEWK